GVDILAHAIKIPLRRIAENADRDGSVVAADVLDEEGNYGFNAQSREYEDLVESGVIDPLKVTRVALQNAAGVAGTMLTTDAMITDLEEEEEGGAPAGGGGGGMPGGMGGMPGGMGGMM
ncbi:MAG: TCP-1/cpn60 chaperonin family protein, partial [Bradymonadaceae bacterium]